VRRLSASAAASAVLALTLMTGAEATSAKPYVARPSTSAGEFAVAVKKLDLAEKWGRLWSLLHPGQRAFIPRSLFVRCLSEHKLVSPKPRTIRAVATLSVRDSIPGVTRTRVPIKAVRVHLDYGGSAPSQTLTTKVVRVRGSWYWITTAGSRKAFIKINFC
jgi:hypothetical protein